MEELSRESLMAGIFEMFIRDRATLCNSRKKALSSPTNLQYEPVFGVKKGKTYYIKVVPAENHDVAHTFTVINRCV